MGHPRWELAKGDGKRNLPQVWGSWELAHGKRNLPHEMGLPKTGNWQLERREEEFTAGDGTSKGDEFTT